MGKVIKFADGLVNLLTGRGTNIDRAANNQWLFIPKTPDQILAAYRSNWLFAKIVDLPAKDMTRERRDWQGENDDIEKLEQEEKRLKLWDNLQKALSYGRLGGGALIIGTGSDAALPLRQGEPVKYLHAVTRYQLGLGQQDMNVDSATFGKPEYFQLSSKAGVRIHPSRVLTFHGEPVPDMGMVAWDSVFWGDPIIDRIGKAVEEAVAASSGFSSLIDEAKIDIYRFAGLADLLLQDGGEAKMQTRISATNSGKSIHRALILDKEDEWQQHQVTWAGMKDIITTYYSLVAGAADIPATRLFGKSPDGLNATGDGDELNYRSKIATDQNTILRPALEYLDALIMPSIVSSDVDWCFPPLSVPTEMERADIDKKKAETAKIYVDTALVPADALGKAVQNMLIEDRTYPGLESALAEMPDMSGEPDPNEPDPNELQANDAKPRSLYVSRAVTNADEIIKWAKSQGFETTLPASDMHVTVLYSRSPVDWMKMGDNWSDNGKGGLTIPAGGARLVEPLGDKGAIVLLFASSSLSWRHEEMVRNGASHDYDEYQPHITITYSGDNVDLSKVEPYRGKIEFGPEIFEELDTDWQPGSE